MAVVLMSLTATLSRMVFIKPPDQVREFTSIPRALLNFALTDAVIDAKPVNDQEELIVSMTLDTEFAYRLVDFCASLVQDTANDWTPTSYLEISSALRGIPTTQVNRHAFTLNDTIRVPQGGEMWIARPLDTHAMPRYVIQNPTSASGPVVTYKATNQNAAVATAGTFNCFFSFLEFDLEQVERFPVHWPIPVYSR